MQLYEAMVIVDPDLTEEEITSALERLQGVIEQSGGTFRHLEAWGKRALAYPIRRKEEGYYAVLEFEGDSNLPGKLHREFRLNQNYIRGMVLRKEE